MILVLVFKLKMEKPNYRLESVKPSDSLDIAGSLRIGHSKDTLDERTFCSSHCKCDTECNCDPHCSCEYNPPSSSCETHECDSVSCKFA